MRNAQHLLEIVQSNPKLTCKEALNILEKKEKEIERKKVNFERQMQKLADEILANKYYRIRYKCLGQFDLYLEILSVSVQYGEVTFDCKKTSISRTSEGGITVYCNEIRKMESWENFIVNPDIGETLEPITKEQYQKVLDSVENLFSL